MRYIGIHSTGCIPSGAVHTEYSHTEQRGKRSIDFYRVWMPDIHQTPNVNFLGVDGEPMKEKISLFSRALQKLAKM